MSSISFTSSDALGNEMLQRVQENARRLKPGHITFNDRKVLKKRLPIIWGGYSAAQSSSKAWRQNRAYEIYTAIQKMSEHLILPAILAITPTDCTKNLIGDVIDRLLHMDSYEQFHLTLSSATEKYFETVAAEEGFSGDRGYLNFMQALFPKSEEPRQIQLAYTTVPLDNIDILFQIMRKGIETSKLWAEERQRGESASGFGVALIPTGDKDCCFTITVGRKDMMDGLRRLRLTQIKIG